MLEPDVVPIVPATDTPRPSLATILAQTHDINFFGYVRALDGPLATIDGCGNAPWSSLPREYFFRGVRRHVTPDRTTCKIRVITATQCKKDGVACKPAALVGCYIHARVHIAPYKFWSGGVLIEGWNMSATELANAKLADGLKKR